MVNAAHPSIASRWLACTLGVLGAVAILVGAASWFHPSVDAGDLWWHLTSGRYVWQHHEIPLTDPFSHTAIGQPWMDHSWLWGTLFWAAYGTQVDLAAWLNLALLVVLFSLVAWNVWRTSRSWLVTGATTWLVAATCHWFLDVRPHLVTLLFTAALLATLDWKRAPWLWPPLMALWVNLHGGFVFGLGLLGLHALVQSAQAVRRGQPLPRTVWAGLLCGALATGLNPWGFAIYEVPWEHFDRNSSFSTLNEWRVLSPSLDPTTFAGRFGWMFIFTLMGVVRARGRPFSIVLAAVTAVMAISARRFVPLFAISAVPLAALGLGSVLDLARRRLPKACGLWPRLVASSAALLVAVLLWNDVRFLPRPLQRWTRLESYPSGAASYLTSMLDPPQRLFNLYAWGGYLMLQTPDVPVFIDGRAGTVYHEDLFEDYLTVISGARGWREKLEAYRIDAVLVPTGAALSVALQSERPAWRVAHIDPRSVLLFPPDGPTRTELGAVSKLLPDGADLQLSRGFRLRRRGDLERAAANLRAAKRLDPMQLPTYGELMLVAASEENAPEVRHWMEEAFRVYPRRWNPILSLAERAWVAMGRSAEELDVLRKMDLGGPFVDVKFAERVRSRIRILEALSETTSGSGRRNKG
jgi:hypothetical protein